ncbi:hypothetical protein CR513_42846, partial [Mucuna pruriens]
MDLDTYEVRFVFVQQEGKIFFLPGKSFWKIQNRALFSYEILSNRLVKQLYNLTLLCSTLPQILLVLPLWFLGHVKLVTSIASLFAIGHYNGFMKNCTSPLVLSTFLLVHLHRMCGLSTLSPSLNGESLFGGEANQYQLQEAIRKGSHGIDTKWSSDSIDIDILERKLWRRKHNS